MRYKKIDVELIVAADEADAIVAELNASFDRLEEKYLLFGGEIEIVSFQHGRRRKRSAWTHTVAAGESVAVALRTVRNSVTTALRTIV